METIVAFATVVIAISAGINSWLAIVIKKANKKRDKEISDLYQAIVVATIVGPHGSSSQGVIESIQNFRKHYKGETSIF